MQYPVSVLARKFTAEHTEYAENINAFLCELSELCGKNNHYGKEKYRRAHQVRREYKYFSL
jgi:hypothetical protein